MIDIESEVYTRLAAAIKAEFESAFVTGEYVYAPSHFPAISIIEEDNRTVDEHMDSSLREKFATVMYDINCYSNLKTGKKVQCRKIMDIVSSEMSAMGFRRTALMPIPNMNDSTIYRMTARFTGVADEHKTIYRR